MPIRAYTPLHPPCRLCGSGFDVVQKSSDPVLAECPRCGQAVQPRAGTPVHTPHLLKPTSVTDAKAAGFTVLKRVGRGEFEKQ